MTKQTNLRKQGLSNKTNGKLPTTPSNIRAKSQTPVKNTTTPKTHRRERMTTHTSNGGSKTPNPVRSSRTPAPVKKGLRFYGENVLLTYVARVYDTWTLTTQVFPKYLPHMNSPTRKKRSQTSQLNSRPNGRPLWLLSRQQKIHSLPTFRRLQSENAIRRTRKTSSSANTTSRQRRSEPL